MGVDARQASGTGRAGGEANDGVEPGDLGDHLAGLALWLLAVIGVAALALSLVGPAPAAPVLVGVLSLAVVLVVTAVRHRLPAALGAAALPAGLWLIGFGWMLAAGTSAGGLVLLALSAALGTLVLGRRAGVAAAVAGLVSLGLAAAAGHVELFVSRAEAQALATAGSIRALEALFLVLLTTLVVRGIGDLRARLTHVITDQADTESRLHDLMQGSIQGILINREGLALFANQALADILGYDDPAEVLALESTQLLFAAHERERLADYHRRRLSGGDAPAQFEVEALRRDGAPCTLHAFVRLTSWHGERAVLLVAVDVTERKRTERALKESEARFRAFFDNSPHAMTSQELDGRYLKDNRKFRELYGIWSADCEGKLPRDIWPDEMAAGIDAANRVVVETRQPYEYEMEFPVHGGELIQLQVLKFPIVSDAGEVLAIGSIGSDVTNRRLAERALTESRERFRDFAEASSDWFWEMSPDLVFTHVSDQVDRAIDVESMNALALTREGGGDREDVRANPEKWRRFWGALQAREPFRGFDFPLRDARGGARHVRASGKPVFSEDGLFLGYRGVGADVTAVVESQRQASMLRDAIDHAGEGVALYDADGCIVFTNAAFHRVLPHVPPPERILGAHRDDIERGIVESGWLVEAAPGSDAHAQVVQLGEAGPAQATSSDEPTFADGHTYIRRYRPSRDGNVLCVLTDITALKSTERELERSHLELRRLASQVSLAEEGERRRIAAELHDGAVQNLGLLRIMLGSLKREIGEGPAAEQVEKLGGLLEQSIRELRSLMSELSPPMLYDLGLAPAVQWLADRFRAQHGLDVTVELEAAELRTEHDISVLLFQAVRELLMNVVKHARAEHAVVSVVHQGATVRVSVADDGIGLDPSDVGRRPSDTGGFGLFSVRERLQVLGGELGIASSRGTKVTLTVPLQPSPAAAGG